MDKTMTTYIETTSGTDSLIHWIKQDAVKYGIINAFYVLDEEGNKLPGSLYDIVDVDQDFELEANIISLDNGRTMIVDKDGVEIK